MCIENDGSKRIIEYEREKVSILKAEKKEQMIQKQKSRVIIAKNKKVNKINMVILGAGLLLMLLGQNVAGNILIWIGVGIFVYTLLSSISSRRT